MQFAFQILNMLLSPKCMLSIYKCLFVSMYFNVIVCHFEHKDEISQFAMQDSENQSKPAEMYLARSLPPFHSVL